MAGNCFFGCGCGSDPYHVASTCCPGDPVPTTLDLTVDYPFGGGVQCQFIDATLTYYPSAMSPVAACVGYTTPIPDGWWSPELTNPGTAGGTFRYFLTCSGGFLLSSVYWDTNPLTVHCYPGVGGSYCSLSDNFRSPPGGANHSTCSPFLVYQDPPATNPGGLGYPVFTISG